MEYSKLVDADIVTENGIPLKDVSIAIADKNDSCSKMLVKGMLSTGVPFIGYSWLREGNYFDGEVQIEGTWIEPDDAEDILVAVETYLDESDNALFVNEFARIAGE